VLEARPEEKASVAGAERGWGVVVDDLNITCPEGDLRSIGLFLLLLPILLLRLLPMALLSFSITDLLLLLLGLEDCL
jgi:hypothetical protein